MTDEQINQAIARVILSTKRKNRQYSLYEIALDIKALKNDKGSISEVAKMVGISSGMLARFLNVFKLPERIIELIRERKIDSVSVITELSKLNDKDALDLAELLVNKKLSSQDLRILIPYRKEFPFANINELIERIHFSKNIKVSVIKFTECDFKKNIDNFKKEMIEIIGNNNFVDLIKYDDHYDLKITKKGEKLLRNIARQKGMTLKNLITNLLK